MTLTHQPLVDTGHDFLSLSTVLVCSPKFYFIWALPSKGCYCWRHMEEGFPPVLLLEQSLATKLLSMANFSSSHRRQLLGINFTLCSLTVHTRAPDCCSSEQHSAPVLGFLSSDPGALSLELGNDTATAVMAVLTLTISTTVAASRITVWETRCREICGSHQMGAAWWSHVLRWAVLTIPPKSQQLTCVKPGSGEVEEAHLLGDNCTSLVSSVEMLAQGGCTLRPLLQVQLHMYLLWLYLHSSDHSKLFTTRVYIHPFTHGG